MAGIENLKNLKKKLKKLKCKLGFHDLQWDEVYNRVCKNCKKVIN